MQERRQTQERRRRRNDDDAGPVAAENCTLTIDPGNPFETAFASLSAGDVLCLNDGTYAQAMDVPAGLHVRAVHDGKAELDGRGTLGTPWSGAVLTLVGEDSSARGLRVHHAGTNSHACQLGGSNNTLRMMSCARGGSYKHKTPLFISGDGHLVEDSWFFGEGRYVVQCFIGTSVTLRHNVARWDATTPNEPTEPNAAFSIYNCSGATDEQHQFGLRGA
ncbi:MAG: hypothetical protein GY822_27835 [Deltaproteobacteria bacterium]|nr:hypothetical protein [Deltaproteobacteria bacterium]